MKRGRPKKKTGPPSERVILTIPPLDPGSPDADMASLQVGARGLCSEPARLTKFSPPGSPLYRTFNLVATTELINAVFPTGKKKGRPRAALVVYVVAP